MVRVLVLPWNIIYLLASSSDCLFANVQWKELWGKSLGTQVQIQVLALSRQMVIDKITKPL